MVLWGGLLSQVSLYICWHETTKKIFTLQFANNKSRKILTNKTPIIIFQLVYNAQARLVHTKFKIFPFSISSRWRPRTAQTSWPRPPPSRHRSRSAIITSVARCVAYRAACTRAYPPRSPWRPSRRSRRRGSTPRRPESLGNTPAAGITQRPRTSPRLRYTSSLRSSWRRRSGAGHLLAAVAAGWVNIGIDFFLLIFIDKWKIY